MTDGRQLMPIARPLLKYGRLKNWEKCSENERLRSGDGLVAERRGLAGCDLEILATAAAAPDARLAGAGNLSRWLIMPVSLSNATTTLMTSSSASWWMRMWHVLIRAVIFCFVLSYVSPKFGWRRFTYARHRYVALCYVMFASDTAHAMYATQT